MSDEEARQALLGRIFDWVVAGSPLPLPKDIPEILPFKDNKSAFEYACNFLECDLKAGAVLPAFVQQVAPYSHDNSLQQCMISVANRDGGISLFSVTVNNTVPHLDAGDLVLYTVDSFVSIDPNVASPLNIIGFVTAKIQPEFHLTKGWRISG